jgi:hypothetical protein
MLLYLPLQGKINQPRAGERSKFSLEMAERQSFLDETGDEYMETADVLYDKEKRTVVRVPAGFSLDIYGITLDKSVSLRSKLFQVQTVDISTLGLSFISEQEVRAKDVLMINSSSAELNLDGMRVKVISRSMHLGAPRTFCHCRFIGLDAEKKNRISRYVGDRLKKIRHE